ncbi:TPA: DnaD domain protein, partial [Streptococcus suis]|nr:DnaD domain protein [Streptococcus suis]
LIQIDEDKNAELPQAKAMVMSETNWASYKREQRQNKERLDNVQKSLTNSNSCPTEIEIEKDIKKDIDINIELEVDNKKTATDTNIYDYYQQRIGSLDGYQYEKLKDYLDIDKLEPELVKRAIDRGADNSKRNFGYINKILKNWAQNGIRTIAQQDEEQRQFVDSKANKQKSNDWVPDPNYPPPY